MISSRRVTRSPASSDTNGSSSSTTAGSGASAGERDSLALASGELVGIGPRPRSREPHECRGTPRLALASGSRSRRSSPTVRCGKRAPLLEDHADPPALGLDPCALANDPAGRRWSTVPASGAPRNPATMRSTVVFPDPLGPSSATTSPSTKATRMRQQRRGCSPKAFPQCPTASDCQPGRSPRPAYDAALSVLHRDAGLNQLALLTSVPGSPPPAPHSPAPQRHLTLMVLRFAQSLTRRPWLIGLGSSCWS